jgi:hypothetical protein
MYMNIYITKGVDSLSMWTNDGNNAKMIREGLIIYIHIYICLYSVYCVHIYFQIHTCIHVSI